jgi:hypothetical protein
MPRRIIEADESDRAPEAPGQVARLQRVHGGAPVSDSAGVTGKRLQERDPGDRVRRDHHAVQADGLRPGPHLGLLAGR